MNETLWIDEMNRRGFLKITEYLQLMKELNLNVYDLIDWMDQGNKVHP